MLSTEDYEFRQRCKLKAIEIAASLKPSPQYSTSYPPQQLATPHYDVIKEADKLYHWLIEIEEEK